MNIRTTIAICCYLILLLLFLCMATGIVLILLAEATGRSLANEFSLLFYAHLLAVALPLLLLLVSLIPGSAGTTVASRLMALLRYQPLQILHRYRRYIFLAGVVAVCTGLLLRVILIHTEPTAIASQEIMFLHTQPALIPDIAFQCAMVPTAAVCALHGTANGVAVLPATAENIRRAATHARVLVIGAHGRDGYIRTVDNYKVYPAALASSTRAVDVYLGACFTGTRHDEWCRVFPDAHVYTSTGHFNAMQGLYHMLFIAPFRYQ